MTTVLVLPADLTHAQATASARMLVQALDAEAGPDVLIDAVALEHFDSSALAVLLECRRAALVRHKTFAVKALPTRLRALAALYGIADLLPEPA